MKKLVLDLETTVQKLDGKTDNSPFNPDNMCVSAHFAWLTDDGVGEVTNLVFHHNEKATPDSIKPLVEALAEADVLIAHNAKFDCLWLQEMGLDLPPLIRCTMINEYILCKGQRKPLSLKMTAERRNVTRKKSDLVDELFKGGTGFEAMPLDTVIEYAEADIVSCGEVFLSQQADLALEANLSLDSIVVLMNEMLLFLMEVETNGICVDMEALQDVKADLVKEHASVSRRLRDIVEQVMGDTPINLNSGADMTKVVYSRSVLDRKEHAQIWNIGMQPNGRPLMPPRMSKSEFSLAVRSTTMVVKRTDALCCTTCNGLGTIQKFKSITRQKNGKKYKITGEPYKNPTKCSECGGAGAVYVENGTIAGLRLNPIDPSFASINGFKTDKHTIKLLISQAREKNNDLAIEFLEKSSRLNALSTYLDSFVKGIETWTRYDNILHSNFNQCITSTGRLSSSNPNFQNQPKRGFPVRKAVISRFPNGKFVEADFSGLEFRVAGEVSRDPQIIEDIVSGKDIHKQTAAIINQCDPSEISKDMRQSAKAYTFAPLYGGTGAGEPDHVRAYFTEFFVIYGGLAGYQKILMDGVLRNGIVQTPSGRQYFWPDAKRTRNGRITNATQVVNYPIQGFATGDLVPLACVRAHRMFKEANLKSLLVLTVHDSICVDCHPDELEQVCRLLTKAMKGVSDEAYQRWGYKFVLPLDIEISCGTNWLNQEELSVDYAT